MAILTPPPNFTEMFSLLYNFASAHPLDPSQHPTLLFPRHLTRRFLELALAGITFDKFMQACDGRMDKEAERRAEKRIRVCKGIYPILYSR